MDKRAFLALSHALQICVRVLMFFTVGLSRQHTAEDAPPKRSMAGRHARKSAESHRSSKRAAGGAAPPTQNDTPFTQEDLALALKRSHLAVPA